MDLQDKILELLNGELGDTERSELTMLLNQNPELKQEKELYERIIEAIEISGEKELRAQLDTYLQEHLHKQQTTNGESGKRRFLYFGGIAAAVVIGFFLYIQKTNTPGKKEPLRFQLDGAPMHAVSDSLNLDSLKQVNDSLKSQQK